MTDLSDLSLEQLQQRLEELGVEWHAVEAAIALKKEADKKDLIAQIRQKIVDAGYRPEEIVAMLRGRRGRTSSRAYTTWVDPDDASNTYARGPLPGWLRDKMSGAGVDPQDKEQREVFKRKHLKKLMG